MFLCNELSTIKYYLSILSVFALLFKGITLLMWYSLRPRIPTCPPSTSTLSSTLSLTVTRSKTQRSTSCRKTTKSSSCPKTCNPSCSTVRSTPTTRPTAFRCCGRRDRSTCDLAEPVARSTSRWSRVGIANTVHPANPSRSESRTKSC
jgi:hypothetical protein